jgi:phospholipase/lecithinase/hemolysin
VGWYNDALSAGAEAFRKRSDVEIRVFDVHARLSWIMDHPGQYGIMNTTGYCAGYDQPNIEVDYEEYGCPVPLEKYFWFNSGHLTSHLHRILAEELEEWLRK